MRDTGTAYSSVQCAVKLICCNENYNTCYNIAGFCKTFMEITKIWTVLL